MYNKSKDVRETNKQILTAKKVSLYRWMVRGVWRWGGEGEGGEVRVVRGGVGR